MRAVHAGIRSLLTSGIVIQMIRADLADDVHARSPSGLGLSEVMPGSLKAGLHDLETAMMGQRRINGVLEGDHIGNMRRFNRFFGCPACPDNAVRPRLAFHYREERRRNRPTFPKHWLQRKKEKKYASECPWINMSGGIQDNIRKILYRADRFKKVPLRNTGSERRGITP